MEGAERLLESLEMIFEMCISSGPPKCTHQDDIRYARNLLEVETGEGGGSLHCFEVLTLVERERDRRGGMARKILGCKHRSKKVLIGWAKVTYVLQEWVCMVLLMFLVSGCEQPLGIMVLV